MTGHDGFEFVTSTGTRFGWYEDHEGNLYLDINSTRVLTLTPGETAMFVSRTGYGRRTQEWLERFQAAAAEASLVLGRLQEESA